MAAENKNQTPLQKEFFDSLGDPLSLLHLFEFVPDVYLYIKNVKGQYVRANQVVCRVVGVESDEEMIGRTDFDFFPPAIAAQYIDEDRRVIESASPLSDQIWLVPDANGIPRMYQCNKVPLSDRNGKVIGIAGLKRPYRQSLGAATGHERLMKVVEYVTENYSEPISVGDLAKSASLSTSQLHREFARRFGITPNQYIREVRIGVARRILETESVAVADIASHCGFYDQSHLTRQFKASTGLTPLQYRKRFNSVS
ncbi:MAG: AraC family transcriptional regulator [Planctomycetaceae bacterium]